MIKSYNIKEHTYSMKYAPFTLEATVEAILNDAILADMSLTVQKVVDLEDKVVKMEKIKMWIRLIAEDTDTEINLSTTNQGYLQIVAQNKRGKYTFN